MDDLERKFLLLKDHYDKLDMRIIERKGLHVFDTSYGIWGCSSLRELFDLFRRIRLDESAGFADLGSGDGRIALLAALFTKSRGIEGDAELHAWACEAKEALLAQIPELDRCTLTHGDYTKEDLRSYDTLFIYADHAWDAAFEGKLLKECNGRLLSYNNIFPPNRLKKGPTLWVEQTPIVTYLLGAESACAGSAPRARG